MYCPEKKAHFRDKVSYETDYRQLDFFFEEE